MKAWNFTKYVHLQAYSKDFDQICNFSIFLKYLGTFFPQNIFQQPFLTAVMFSKIHFYENYSFITGNWRLRQQRTLREKIRSICNVKLFQTYKYILAYSKTEQTVSFIISRVDWEPSQSSKMRLFLKIVDDFQSLNHSL